MRRGQCANIEPRGAVCCRALQGDYAVARLQLLTMGKNFNFTKQTVKDHVGMHSGYLALHAAAAHRPRLARPQETGFMTPEAK
jgi:hypothetical protein